VFDKAILPPPEPTLTYPVPEVAAGNNDVDVPVVILPVPVPNVCTAVCARLKLDDIHATTINNLVNFLIINQVINYNLCSEDKGVFL
jgi:hypothetical protein